MTKFLPVLIVTILFFASGCKIIKSAIPVPGRDTISMNGAQPPGWILQGNIYEVNVRQYTPEGTFKAFQKHLDRLKKMGVQTLWFMPIQPISKVDRKGTLGSYYAVADYQTINPEFGTLEDWKALVAAAHSKGFKVLIDWVANHTGADHPWLTNHPRFYEKDSTGKPISAFDWSDTRSLDFTNQTMRDSMIASMKFWIVETDIDGFRCDVAGEVPDDFWRSCVNILRRQKELFMLAEGEKPSLHQAGFDASYAWEMFHTMKNIAKGEQPATSIDKVRVKHNSTYPANAIYMYFTSNHDENSWNNADYGTMPGAVHAPFAILTQTLQGSVPLIYSGQEEPVLRKVEFFEKDTMNFAKFQRAKFYTTLLNLRRNNASLAANASFQKISVGDDNSLYAFIRTGNGRKVLVILNLSSKDQKVQVNDPNLYGNTLNIFTDKKLLLNNKPWTMEPWGYAVYEYR